MGKRSLFVKSMLHLPGYSKHVSRRAVQKSCIDMGEKLGDSSAFGAESYMVFAKKEI